MNIIAILPYKGMAKSKSRLSEVLPDDKRIQLSIAMLTDILNALSSSNYIHKVILVTPDTNVIEKFEGNKKVKAIIDHGKGQIEAVNKGVESLKDEKVDVMIYCVADTPLIRAKNFDEIISLVDKERTVILSPSIDGGTNILLEYPPKLINLKYGPSSFIKHVYEAKRKGLNVKFYTAIETIIDIDTIEDLMLLSSLCKNGSTYEILRSIQHILDNLII